MLRKKGIKELNDKPMIDSHIHPDFYEQADIDCMMRELPHCGVDRVVAVSVDLASCRNVQRLYHRYPEQIVPAYGQHPERSLPLEKELDELFDFIRQHQKEMAAVGEVGLPYYSRKKAEHKGERFALEPYMELLEAFVQLAKELDKPIVLHAVYEDANLAFDLLEKYSISRAHFHWFKGNAKTAQRLMENGYFVSFTPDIVYAEEIRTLAKTVIIEQTMVETDGPWPFEGPFQGQKTHPRMIHSVIQELASLKSLSFAETDAILLANTEKFYGIR